MCVWQGLCVFFWLQWCSLVELRLVLSLSSSRSGGVRGVAMQCVEQSELTELDGAVSWGLRELSMALYVG